MNLTLIIQIVKDRRFCGLTTIDSLKRELIYKLSTRHATRSQLVESIPCDLSDFEQLQSIVDMVASNSNTSSINQVLPNLEEINLFIVFSCIYLDFCLLY